MGQKFTIKCEFEAGFRHAMTGKLSVKVTFYKLGKDKAVKREGWAQPFISCVQDTV